MNILGVEVSDILNAKTITESQFDNLKLENNNTRVWVSRMTVADGMEYNNQITVEKLNNGTWETIEEVNPSN